MRMQIYKREWGTHDLSIGNILFVSMQLHVIKKTAYRLCFLHYLWYNHAMGFMKKGTNKTGHRRKFFLAGCLSLVAVGAFFPSARAFAQSATLEGFASILTLFIQIFTFLSLKMIELGGYLLGSDFIIGEEAMSGLRPMWITIRNITYIGFVIVLVGLAFTNLFGVADWQIKDKLPRVILAMVLIHFSLPVVRLAIVGVDIATTAIMSFADTSLEQFGATSTVDILESRTDEKGEICYSENAGNCLTFAKRINEQFCAGKDTPSTDCLFFIDLDKARQGTSSSANANNLFLAFGVYFQQLEQLPRIASQLETGTNFINFRSWTEVAQDSLFAAIMGVLYMVSLAMMFVALLARMVILWLTIAASPLLIAAAVLGIGGSGGDFVGKVVGALTLPLKVAAAMAVSFIMISGMSDLSIVSTDGVFVRAGSNVFTVGTYGFLWQILTVVVFWQAAKWATSNTGIASIDGVVSTIASGTEGFGSLLASSILNRPIFSIKDGSGSASPNVSLGALKSIPNIINSAQVNQLEKQKQVLRGMTGPASLDKELQAATNNLKTMGRKFTDVNEAMNSFHQTVSKKGTTGMSTAAGIEYLKTMKGKISEMENVPQASRDRAIAQLDRIIENPNQDPSVYSQVARELGAIGVSDFPTTASPVAATPTAQTPPVPAQNLTFTPTTNDEQEPIVQMAYNINGVNQNIPVKSLGDINNLLRGDVTVDGAQIAAADQQALAAAIIANQANVEAALQAQYGEGGQIAFDAAQTEFVRLQE